MKEETFNKWFSAFILVGMTVALVLTTILKFDAAQSGRALLLVSAFGSLMGVLATVLSANGIIWTFLFGLLDVAIYGVMCFISGKYGNAVMHFVYFVPMQFVGFVQWKKRGAEGTKSQVKARRFSVKQAFMYTGIFVAGTAVAYFILCRFSPSAAGEFLKWAVLMDAFSVVCNIIGQLLMSTAYMEQWIFWIGVNVSSILMWALTLKDSGDSYALIYIIKYSFYLVNSLNGLRIWLRLSKAS